MRVFGTTAGQGAEWWSVRIWITKRSANVSCRGVYRIQFCSAASGSGGGGGAVHSVSLVCQFLSLLLLFSACVLYISINEFARFIPA